MRKKKTFRRVLCEILAIVLSFHIHLHAEAVASEGSVDRFATKAYLDFQSKAVIASTSSAAGSNAIHTAVVVMTYYSLDDSGNPHIVTVTASDVGIYGATAIASVNSDGAKILSATSKHTVTFQNQCWSVGQFVCVERYKRNGKLQGGEFLIKDKRYN